MHAYFCGLCVLRVLCALPVLWKSRAICKLLCSVMLECELNMCVCVFVRVARIACVFAE